MNEKSEGFLAALIDVMVEHGYANYDEENDAAMYSLDGSKRIVLEPVDYDDDNSIRTVQVFTNDITDAKVFDLSNQDGIDELKEELFELLEI